MKTLIILILLLLVLGLYFSTDFTKEVIDITGQFISEKLSGIFS